MRLRRLSWANIADLGIDMNEHMPTNPDNYYSPIVLDNDFWTDYGDELRERFANWIAPVRLVARSDLSGGGVSRGPHPSRTSVIARMNATGGDEMHGTG